VTGPKSNEFMTPLPTTRPAFWPPRRDSRHITEAYKLLYYYLLLLKPLCRQKYTLKNNSHLNHVHHLLHYQRQSINWTNNM